MSRLAIGLLVLLLVAGVVLSRGMGFSSRRAPLPLEPAVARSALRWATPSAIGSAANPVKNSPDVLRDAMAHWADHCALCHGNDGRGTPLGRSLYPPAPDMTSPATQGLSDGELFYMIEHGIPLTGMPAWGNGTADGEKSSWALVRFIRHLPQLTPEDLVTMEKMNPKTQADVEREKEIKDFLSAK
jgi:mono/diheme cytochrome c family protein